MSTHWAVATAAPRSSTKATVGWATLADFPLDSVAHVEPRAQPGFFLVRDRGGILHALWDRSPHRGQPLELSNPFPGTSQYPFQAPDSLRGGPATGGTELTSSHARVIRTAAARCFVSIDPHPTRLLRCRTRAQ
jgi:hypothetical protein